MVMGKILIVVKFSWGIDFFVFVFWDIDFFSVHDFWSWELFVGMECDFCWHVLAWNESFFFFWHVIFDME